MVVKVHRLAYQLFHGVALTPIVKVRHSYDNPPCYELSHLLTGSQADNVRDRVERDRSSRQGNPKVTDEQRLEIARRYRDGESPKLLALEYGLDRTRIWQIGKTA